LLPVPKEESDFDKSCHSSRSEESAGAYEQAAVGPSEGFLLNPDSSLRSEDNSFCFYKLTEHIDNTAQAEQNL